MDIGPMWKEHQQKLSFFIRGHVSNRCDAEDLLHEVFLKIKTKSRSLRDREKAVSWIYQITRNAIIDYYRRHKKTVELPEDLPALKKEKNAWELISRCVRPFIEDLPKIYREVLILSEIQGLDQTHVAKKLGISLTNAKARIRRGKLKLKEKFDECCIFKCGPRGAEVRSDTFEKEG